MRYVYVVGILVLLAACAHLPSECQGQSDAYDRDYCVLRYSLDNNVSEYCEKISNVHWQSWCYTDVAANTQDYSLCENLQDEEREHCIKNVGIAKLDKTICASIQGSQAGDECYSVIATEMKDATLCSSVEGVDMKNKCFVDLAEELDEYTLCKFVEQDTKRRDACLFRVTLRNNVTEGCADIFVPETRDICYVNHAIKKLDTTICEKIGEDAMAGSCRAAVKLAKEKEESPSDE